MIEQTSQEPPFEFTANNLCLDFVNTVNDRLIAQPRDLLGSYSDFVVWGRQAHILTEDDEQQLLAEAERQPAEATEVLQRAKALREALFRVFNALSNETSPDEGDLNTLNAELAEAMAQTHIVYAGDRFAWDWTGLENALSSPLWPVARAAAELLTSEEWRKARMCAADDCGWLFLDTSKNHSRRWCDMNTCGNRAKARSHYVRKRSSEKIE